MRSIAGAVLALGVLLCAPLALAEQASRELEVSGRFGVTYQALSRSLALQHLFRPSARVAGMLPLSEDLKLGGALSSALTTSGNYWVSGAGALARYRLVDLGWFDLGALAMLGVGHNAPILHRDLEAGFPLIPYGYLGVEGRFRLGETLWLGVELGDEQLSVVHLGATLALQL